MRLGYYIDYGNNGNKTKLPKKTGPKEKWRLYCLIAIFIIAFSLYSSGAKIWHADTEDIDVAAEKFVAVMDETGKIKDAFAEFCLEIISNDKNENPD